MPSHGRPPAGVVAVIPVFNEVRFIGGVVERVLCRLPVVIVVDDGSTDGSGESAARRGATVIRHERNRGKGAALQSGFRGALDAGCEGVVTLDGDGQHSPEDIPRLLEAARECDADVVIGRRRRVKGVMPEPRRLVNASSSALVSLLTGRRFSDIHSGFRFLRRRVLERVPLRARGFDAETAFLFDIARRRFRVVEEPVETLYGDQESKIRPVTDTMRFFAVTLRGVVHGL